MAVGAGPAGTWLETASLESREGGLCHRRHGQHHLRGAPEMSTAGQEQRQSVKTDNRPHRHNGQALGRGGGKRLARRGARTGSDPALPRTLFCICVEGTALGQIQGQKHQVSPLPKALRVPLTPAHRARRTLLWMALQAASPPTETSWPPGTWQHPPREGARPPGSQLRRPASVTLGPVDPGQRPWTVTLVESSACHCHVGPACSQQGLAASPETGLEALGAKNPRAANHTDGREASSSRHSSDQLGRARGDRCRVIFLCFLKRPRHWGKGRELEM